MNPNQLHYTAMHLNTSDCNALSCTLNLIYCAVLRYTVLSPSSAIICCSDLLCFSGEGTQHVLKVAVTGAPSDIFARDLGRFVTNSNLVKCAMAGCDPNVGRIVGTCRYTLYLKRLLAVDRLFAVCVCVYSK